MPQSPRVPFHFHAHAQALGGDFRHPLWSIVPAQASASLPTVGGHATAESRDFHFQDFIHFKLAHTHISGKQHRNDTFVTHASTVITGLNVLGRITADRIVSRLTSVHTPADPEGHIIADDSRFEGLKIDGFDVKVTLRHNLLINAKTYADLAQALVSAPKSGRIHSIDSKRQVATCSLVDSIETKLPAVVDPQRHLIELKGFGRIFLAEIFNEPGTKTLTMLHLELGSPHVASLAIAESVTNGQEPPPGIGG
jgi:hypothetical protein